MHLVAAWQLGRELAHEPRFSHDNGLPRGHSCLQVLSCCSRARLASGNCRPCLACSLRCIQNMHSILHCCIISISSWIAWSSVFGRIRDSARRLTTSPSGSISIRLIVRFSSRYCFMLYPVRSLAANMRAERNCCHRTVTEADLCDILQLTFIRLDLTMTWRTHHVEQSFFNQ